MSDVEILNDMLNNLHDMRERTEPNSVTYGRYSNAISALAAIIDEKLAGR